MLSCEWRRLGICHPDMIFTKHTFFDPNNAANQARTAAEDVFIRRRMTPEFITNVDNVLCPLWSTPTTTATTTTLDRFVVNFGLCRCHAHHVDGWIHFAAASRAKHIALDFIMGGYSSEDNKYIFPLSELGGPNGSSVKSLDLANVCLDVPAPGFRGIANLNELRLRAMSINGEALQCLLLGSALLECLTIKNCSFSSLCTLRSGITNLKELSLSSVYFNNGDGLRCLLLGCALLESLSIDTCSCFTYLSLREELPRLKY